METTEETEKETAAAGTDSGPREEAAEAAATDCADAAEPQTPAEPDWKDMYARTRADFDNFRKRTARDREDIVKFAAADILKDILPTLDNLSRALDGAQDRADDPFVSGVRLVRDGLVKMLASHGATPIDSAGEPFDANFHEAIAQIPSADVPEGHVVEEVKRGWLLNGKLLRAAQVVVSSGAPAPAEEA